MIFVYRSKYRHHRRRMLSCSLCGKTYKHQGGLNNHIKRCGAGAASAAGAAGGGAAVGVKNNTSSSGTAAPDSDDITKSPFFTIPLTSFKPTANFTKEDLEELERRKQARLHAILKSQEDEKKRAEAAAASAASAAASVAKAVPTSTNTVVTNNTSNTGNEEHNASFNIKYVKRSEETQDVVQAVITAAKEYCKGRIILTSDEPAPGGGPLTGISTSVNEDGTTVYNHPTRTISIIETPPEEVSPEEEHEIILEKMTYLIISLIQNNNKLKKENFILRSIVARIDPACFEDDDDDDE